MLTLEELKTLHDKAYQHGYDTRLRAAEDIAFAWVSQWDDSSLDASDLGYRGEFNILRKAMRQIMADLVANPVQVDFEPSDDTQEELADIVDGIYRAGARANTSQEAKKNCNQESVVSGVGAWMLETQYKNDIADDDRQVIIRKPLYEANNTVFWDPNARLLDKSDATYVSVLCTYSEDGYKALYKSLTGNEVDSIDCNFAPPEESNSFSWISQDKKIHVVKFFHREKKDITYYTFADMFGEEKTIEEVEFKDFEDKFVDEGYEFVSEKVVTRHVITRYIASGKDILESERIAGEHLPVVPQYGERQYVDGEEHYEGIVRLAKDPQRLRNFQLSYLADITSRSPREKPIFTSEQLNGFEDMYELGGADNNYPYLKQNGFTLDGQPLPVGPVGYLKAPEVPPALMQSIAESRAAVDDVASVGLVPNIADTDLSGKAVTAMQKRIDMQSYTYQDNHKYASRRDGEIYASMLSDIMDTEQEVTLVKYDGSKSKERVNSSEMDYSTMERKTTNNLSHARFDVYADIGPAFESVKEQQREEMKELLNGVPPGTPIHNLLLNQYLTLVDGAGFDDIRDYARKELIMMGVKKPETDEEKQMVEQAQQNQQPDPQAQALQMEGQARMMEGQAALMNEQTDALNAQTKMHEAETKRYKVQVDAQAAGAKITKTQVETVGAQLDNQIKSITPVRQAI